MSLNIKPVGLAFVGLAFMVFGLVSPTSSYGAPMLMAAADTSYPSEVFRLKIDPAVIRKSECVNPEATFLLGILAVRSQSVVPDLPVSGDGSSSKAVSCEGIRDIVWSSDKSIIAAGDHFQELGSDVRASFTWQLQSKGDLGTLFVTHRRTAGSAQAVTKIYPDMVATLRWIRSKRAGDIGYWNLEAWGVGLD